jgi:glycosyltransferase involved in cell wall biosynthesis
MRILALEPYYGGSHKAFLDGWSQHSCHQWTILGLPAHSWKWRMRHAAVFFSEQVAERAGRGEQWDCLFCSDMLNLAEFRGLCPTAVANLPSVAYFHENQLTYPVQHEFERDFHFAYTNFTTALSADQVWFNSAFHRGEFLDALPRLLKRMPDYQNVELVEQVAEKSLVFHPGIEAIPDRPPRANGPMRILWAARWERDKDPEFFFEAMRSLKAAGVKFRLNVIGEQFREVPDVFASAQAEFVDEIERWGYQPNRDAYIEALHVSDVVVSTARHEFFGLSVVEAIAAGAYPLLPRRLSYPELLDVAADSSREEFFYGGDIDTLARRLEGLSLRIESGSSLRSACNSTQSAVDRFHWRNCVSKMDDAVTQMLRSKPS